MNARGSTEVIIATIGLSMGALNQNLFTMIVAMAVITTLAMPPTLRWALTRIPMRKEEKQRLEREEQEEKGFVPNLERLLIAVDDSPNGKFASRVAGMLAGTHGMPTTVLHIKDAAKIENKKLEDKDSPAEDSKTAKAAEKKADVKKSEKEDNRKKTDKDEKLSKAQEKKAENAGDTVKEAAELIKSKQKEEEKVDTPVEVTTIVHEAPGPEVIAAEAEKGYDLMLIGVEKTMQRQQGLPRQRARAWPTASKARWRSPMCAAIWRKSRPASSTSWSRSTAPSRRAAPPKSPSPWRAPTKLR